MTTNRMLCLLMAAGSLPAVAVAQSGPLAHAPAGDFRGTASSDVAAFKGIPYAAPPIGPYRWRAPQAADRSAGIHGADHYGPDCAQAIFPGDAAPIVTTPSEDCLYLNVWKPAAAKAGTKLPVMVWVHGGGFVNGGSSPAVYSGEKFARDGIVFVSFNYRLGRFGFFAHPALAAEGGGGNFGFMDQMAALRWVQRNIAAFGGDPRNVTLFGESAGGISVHVLMTAPDARGLFAKAIIESGAGRDGALQMRTLPAAEQAGEAFANAKSAAELRALTTSQVVAGLNMATMSSPTYSGPLIDGKTILRTPFDSYRAGDYARVPLVVGTNTADWVPSATDKSAIFALYGPLADKARAIYDPTGAVSGADLANTTWADRNMVEPARAIARIASRTQSVYLYRFGYVTPALRATTDGAPHASEIPYVFDTVDARQQPPFDPADAAVADIMHRYWVNFAKMGAPGGANMPAWPRYRESGDVVQAIDGAGARQIPDPIKDRLDLSEQASDRQR